MTRRSVITRAVACLAVGAFAEILVFRHPVGTPPVGGFAPRPWWALVLEGLLLAGMCWIVLAVPGVLWRLRRARRRHARGLCVVCGYDLAGNLAAGCPECGWGK